MRLYCTENKWLDCFGQTASQCMSTCRTLHLLRVSRLINVMMPYGGRCSLGTTYVFGWTKVQTNLIALITTNIEIYLYCDQSLFSKRPYSLSFNVLSKALRDKYVFSGINQVWNNSKIYIVNRTDKTYKFHTKLEDIFVRKKNYHWAHSNQST